jgi:hypothetical protein
MPIYRALVAGRTDGSGLIFDAPTDDDAVEIAEVELRQQCGRKTILVRRADASEIQIWHWEKSMVARCP